MNETSVLWVSAVVVFTESTSSLCLAQNLAEMIIYIFPIIVAFLNLFLIPSCFQMDLWYHWGMLPRLARKSSRKALRNNPTNEHF